MQATIQSIGTSFAPSNKILESLIQLAKALPKSSSRTYGECIGIRRGFAYITDGYGLIRFQSTEFESIDSTLNRFLHPSPVKYPGVENAISAEDAREVDALNVIELLAHFKPGASCSIQLVIGDDGSPRLCRAKPGDFSVNPIILVQLMKGLPKSARVQSVEIRGDQLQMKFGRDSEYLVLAVRVEI